MKSDHFVSGYKEILISVWDLKKTCTFVEEVLQYELVTRGPVSRGLLSFWGLGEECTAEEALYRHVGTEICWYRIVQFQGVEQRLIRPNSQTWDTGGIYDVDFRVVDFEARVEDFQRAGFLGFSDPMRYQFGPYDVSEILMKGHEDYVLAVMTRHAPKLEGYPHLTYLSEPFNSTQIVKDYGAAVDFYINQLGFKIQGEYALKDTEDTTNLFGMPQNLYKEIERNIVILGPLGVKYGSIEIIELKGAQGRDFSEHAKPPNLGMLMLRIPIVDIEGYHALIQSTNPSEIKTVEIAPYGEVKVFYVLTPDGTWLEFGEF